jgi:hypothetical protein
MVSVLQSLGQSGQLETDLPAQRGKERSGHLTISVKDGHILYWQLTTAQGLAASGREPELRSLSRSYQVRLHWHFFPLQPSGATSPGSFSQYSPSIPPPPVMPQSLSGIRSSQPPPSQSSPAWGSYHNGKGDQRTPRRHRHISSDELAEMPRQYRTVYALVNGINSVEHIARLLSSMDRQSIITILQELTNRSLIQW